MSETATLERLRGLGYGVPRLVWRTWRLRLQHQAARWAEWEAAGRPQSGKGGRHPLRPSELDRFDLRIPNQRLEETGDQNALPENQS